MLGSLQLHCGAHVVETHREAAGLSAHEPCTVIALSFSSLSRDLELITARILFQFSSFAFCICLCFTVTMEGITVFDSFSYLRCKNILHSLAIVHAIIWITGSIYTLF